MRSVQALGRSQVFSRRIAGRVVECATLEKWLAMRARRPLLAASRRRTHTRIRIREFKGDPDAAPDRGDSLGNIDRLCSMTGKMKAKRQSANRLCQPQDAITDQQSRARGG